MHFPTAHYSDDSLKWRTHLNGTLGVFLDLLKIHLSGAPPIFGEIGSENIQNTLKTEKNKVILKRNFGFT